jgi:hypothetical protein
MTIFRSFALVAQEAEALPRHLALAWRGPDFLITNVALVRWGVYFTENSFQITLH